MQIHELNNFTGTLGSGAYLAIDDGTDTGKISSQELLAATEARIDNIIAGPAPSAEEIVDARLGADGVTYPSLGDAIRDQFTDVKSDLSRHDTDLDALMGLYNSETLVGEFIQFTKVGALTRVSAETSGKAVLCKKNLFDDSQLSALATETAHEFYGKGSDFTALGTFPINSSKNLVVSMSVKADTDMTLQMQARIFYADGTNRNIVFKDFVSGTYQRKSLATLTTSLERGDVTGLLIMGSSNTSSYVYVKDIMVEEGDDLSSFEAFDGKIISVSTSPYYFTSNGLTSLMALTADNSLTASVAVDRKVDATISALKVTKAIPISFDSADDRCKLELSGYSGKKAFISNKNLLPQFPAITDHGVTCTKNSDGSITLSGTSDGTASFQLTANAMPTVGKGTYTLSARNPSAIGDDLTYINPVINGTYSSTISCKLNSSDAQTTFTLDDEEKITGIRIRISSGVVIPSNYKLYPQLEEGEERTEFVAHDGSVIDLTASETEVDCFVGYNYITAQDGVTGTVSFLMSASKEINDIDARVTVLENTPTLSKKFYGKKIVCFGDSITGNFPAPLDYPSMIAEITGATVYNAGFGGCCMSDNGQTRKLFTMCRLADSIVAGDFSDQEESGVSITYAGTSTNYVPERLAMLESIDWSDIDYITIAYGTNDWNSNYGLDNADNPLDTTTYIGAFRYSVEKLLTAYPNLKILVITPLWRWWDANTGMPSEIHSDYIDSNDYAKGTGYKLWQYGDALADAAKLYHIHTFNLYWNCMMTKQNRLEYFDYNDGTHPKLKGRELMAELISAQLEAIY